LFRLCWWASVLDTYLDLDYFANRLSSEALLGSHDDDVTDPTH
jgi:hypothetical protein